MKGSGTVTTVKLLALWVGWCDPCHVERPLALTEHGSHGLRAWLRGVAAEDRHLVLACEVCGQWQPVPGDEADDPEPLAAPAGAAEVAVDETRPPLPSMASLPAAVTATRCVVVPAPRQSAAQEQSQVLDLVAVGLDILSMP